MYCILPTFSQEDTSYIDVTRHPVVPWCTEVTACQGWVPSAAADLCQVFAGCNFMQLALCLLKFIQHTKERKRTAISAMNGNDVFESIYNLLVWKSRHLWFGSAERHCEAFHVPACHCGRKWIHILQISTLFESQPGGTNYFSGALLYLISIAGCWPKCQFIIDSGGSSSWYNTFSAESCWGFLQSQFPPSRWSLRSLLWLLHSSEDTFIILHIFCLVFGFQMEEFH